MPDLTFLLPYVLYPTIFVGAVYAFQKIKFQSLSAAWASLSRTKTAAPAEVVEPKPAAPAEVVEPKPADPAELLMDAARLYLRQGDSAKAVKVFAMAAEQSA